MFASATVKLERTSDRTARLTLNRPGRRNAVNPQLAQDFAAGVAQILAWNLPLAVLDAEGPAFCAGVDLSDLAAGGAALEEILELLASAPIHWTAKVTGAARGAGLSMLAMCPVVIASTDAHFGLPEIAKGFFPAAVVPSQVALVGARRGFELAFTGSPVNAQTALEWGLVSAVVQPDVIDAYLDDRLTVLEAHEPAAIADGVRAWQDQLVTGPNRQPRSIPDSDTRS